MLADENVTDIDSISDSDLPLVTLGDFLEDISLLSAIDMSADEDAMNKITLMTIHSSKGLEFPYVYVAGMEENIFPSGGSFSSPSEIEEERRLFYVALTRAKVAVCLSFAATRMRNGKHEQNSPSRFVKEINARYIDNPLRDDDPELSAPRDSGFSGFGSRFGYGARFSGGRQSSGYERQYTPPEHSHGYGTSGAVKVIHQKAPASPVTGRPMKPVRDVRQNPANPLYHQHPVLQARDSDFIPVSVLDLKVGQRIEHNRFGLGQITQISGTGTDLKARIVFDNFGEKILLLKYAKIRVPKE